jgi:hypothetical protein
VTSAFAVAGHPRAVEGWKGVRFATSPTNL